MSDQDILDDYPNLVRERDELRSLLAAAEARNEIARKALENTQGAVHLLRKAIHAADPRAELDFRCHDIWTEIETALTRSQSSGGGNG